MSVSDQNSFDDPQFKAAVVRAWGGEVAPASLRQRIEAMGLGAASAPAADIVAPARLRRATSTFWPAALRHAGPVYGVAAVVMMVIGFAVAYRLDQPPAWRETFTSPMTISTGPGGAADVVPVSLANELVTAHARCTRSSDHNAFKDVPRADLNTLRRRLQGQLNFPVLAGPVDDGKGRWDFRGASVCPVDRFSAAHLLFARKGQSVSLFSLPRSSCPQAHAGDVAEDPSPDHPLAVFVGSEGVQCVVGSSDDGSMSPADLRDICDHLRPYLE
jgi:hypothetical protein